MSCEEQEELLDHGQFISKERTHQMQPTVGCRLSVFQQQETSELRIAQQVERYFHRCDIQDVKNVTHWG